ncbi:MAG TPA: SCP2 sterol-binding domain-containing protein, partial [Dehalococcoidia bacterium]|nr:SCP2 sterol-binding domain-containing protein [Dehalococcoidia bacterium]
RDVVAHLLGNCSGEFDEAFRRALDREPTPVIPGDLNAWNDAQAASRRDWPPKRFCQEYERASAGVATIIEQWDADMETPVRLAEAIPPRPFWLEVRVLSVHHWVHGQDIRKAVGRPGGVTDERMRPVIQAYFDMMPLVFQADRAKDSRLRAAFQLSGPGGGRWVAEIGDGQCSVRSDGEGRADVTFRGTTWNFYRIGQGLINPALSVLTLKILPVGNPLMALRFVSLFRTGKSAVNQPVQAPPP